MIKLELHSVKKLLLKRMSDSHKGNHGHALIIAGSKSKMGAAIIAAKACLRSGAGLATINIPTEERAAFFKAIPEAMVALRENETNWNAYTSFAIGPGIGTDKESKKLLRSLLENIKTPIVFDADALNMIAKEQKLLLLLPQHSILTPHVKEFDRLFGTHSSEKERREKALLKATELKIIIVLKGAKTFITDGEKSFENTTGNPGLAKGGSGDALTGIISGLLAQGYEPINAAKLGVFLHGLAADITLETQSAESMLITDVIENLGKGFKKIQN